MLLRFRFAARPLLWVIRLLALLQVLVQFAIWLPAHWHRTDSGRDIPVYYQAARIASGQLPEQPLYRPYSNYSPQIVPNRYFYPPSFAAVISPLGKLSEQRFSQLWYLVLLAGFWAYAACLSRLATGRYSFWNVLIAGLVLQLWPGANTALSYGNAEPLMWALFGGALVFHGGKRGMALAAATLIKVHPALLLILALRSDGRKVAWAGLSVLLAGVLLGTAVCGPESWGQWREAASPVAAQGTLWPENVSISFAGLRLMQALGWDFGVGALPTAARWYLAFCALTAPLICAWLSRRADVTRQLAFTACATVLFAPLCWNMYLPLLLAPAALELRRWWSAVDFDRTL
jgi:hypothetical protein